MNDGDCVSTDAANLVVMGDDRWGSVKPAEMPQYENNRATVEKLNIFIDGRSFEERTSHPNRNEKISRMGLIEIAHQQLSAWLQKMTKIGTRVQPASTTKWIVEDH